MFHKRLELQPIAAPKPLVDEALPFKQVKPDRYRTEPSFMPRLLQW